MLDAVVNRRSIRHYENRPAEPGLIDQLKEAVLRAPSSRNLRPWKFVFVSDSDTLQALSLSKPQWATPVAEAPLAVAVCAEDHVSDCWIEDCSIAATILQLTATDLGLGSCWIQIRERTREDGSPSEAYVREVLGLGEGHRVLCLISLGYPAEAKEPKPLDELLWGRIL